MKTQYQYLLRRISGNLSIISANLSNVEARLTKVNDRLDYAFLTEDERKSIKSEQQKLISTHKDTFKLIENVNKYISVHDKKPSVLIY